MEEKETWEESRAVIRFQLSELKTSITALSTQLTKNHAENQIMYTQMKVDIAMLQVKAGVWGLIGGAIPVLVLVLVSWLKLPV
jgi:hypothetical protein